MFRFVCGFEGILLSFRRGIERVSGEGLEDVEVELG